MQIMCPYQVDTICSAWKGTLPSCATCSWNQPLQYYANTNIWQTCPICGGTGHVSGSFYTSLGGQGTSADISQVCRTCNGKGIISTLNGLPPV